MIARCAGTCNPAASKTLDPRLKFQFLEDGYGIADTEYPKGKVEGTEDIGRPDDLRPRRRRRGEHRRRGQLGRIEHRTESAGALLLARPGDPLLRPGRRLTTPAAKLPTPEVLQKPDITATDCASTTFFGNFVAGIGWEFCGTSEAAEHAATIAALMQQSNPLATPAQIVDAMESTATKFTVVKLARRGRRRDGQRASPR